MKAPEQLFDSADPIAPSDQSAAPKTGESESAPEFPPLDVAAFEKLWASVCPAKASDEFLTRVYREQGAAHVSLLGLLSPAILRQFLLSLPARDLFAFLGEKPFAPLKKILFRGFQVTPQQLRNPAVLARLQAHLTAHPLELYALFLALAFDSQKLEEWVGELDTEEKRLALAAQVGPLDALFLALANADFPAVEAYLEKLDNPREWSDALEQKRREMDEQTAPAKTPEAPEPDSESARFWKARAEELLEQSQNLQSSLRRKSEQDKSAHRLENELEKLRRENEKLKANEKQLSAQWEKRLAAQRTKQETVLAELRQHDDRQMRKLHKLEREFGDLETELKKVKKQLRLAQQVLEDERKIVASLKAQLETPVLEVPEPAPPVPIVKPAIEEPKTPLDDVFEWRADGRSWKITPRAVKRMIDCNDEEGLWPIQLALQVLESSDKEKYNRFFFRLRCEDPSYASVLTQPTQRVLVDASNVTRAQTNKHGRGLLKNLLQMRDELRRLGCWPILLWADASLRHNVDEGKKYAEMVTRGEILQADKGVEADEILAREARNWGASVVTNDARFFQKVSPDFEPPRIGFRIYNGVVVVDDF